MSDSAFLNGVSVKPAPGIPSLPFSLLPSFARLLLRGRPGSVSRSTQASTCHCAGKPLLPTPGALRLRSELCCLDPSSPNPTPCASPAGTLRLRFYTYTQRLRCAGAPRRTRGTFPTFACRTLFHTCRRPYPGGPPCLPVILTRRFQASSNFYRVANHNYPPLPAIPDGAFISGLHRSLYLRPACLPCPPGWLRQDEATCISPCLLRYIVTPAFGAVRHRMRWESG